MTGAAEGLWNGQKKGRQQKLPAERGSGKSDVGLGLAQALDAIARLPLVALAEQLDALEALQDVAFNDETGGALEAFVL
jgi:hypothetical protein